MKIQRDNKFHGKLHTKIVGIVGIKKEKFPLAWYFIGKSQRRIQGKKNQQINKWKPCTNSQELTFKRMKVEQKQNCHE